ncbi:MAG: cytolethal distending toxin subunit B family protein [Pasteurellaceae bacterium]|nr:cytolethal distending toxin subunit B family protein [Pasteurellaceae bacterium]
MKRLYILLGGLLSAVCSANLHDFRVATWNLQGSSAANESKWNINVRQLLTGIDAADILMVQEAGTLPASATRTGRMVQPAGVGIPIEEYLWNLGTGRRPDLVYIYYSRIDVGANRVNLAIVSRRRADEVFVVTTDSTVLLSRPAIGIRIQNDVFLSAHALASGGSDAGRIVEHVYRFFSESARNRYNWMLVGDFNRSPNSLENFLRTQEPATSNNTLILAPTEPTHRSGNILDYAVLHNADQGQHQTTDMSASIMFNQFRSQIASDHFPVSFVRNRK